jgi:hypothetical protein
MAEDPIEAVEEALVHNLVDLGPMRAGEHVLTLTLRGAALLNVSSDEPGVAPHEIPRAL